MNIVNLLTAKEFERVPMPNYSKLYLGLSESFKAQSLGFNFTILEPKNFSWPYHSHSAEEEMFFVLEGEGIVRLNNDFRKVKAGDLVFYPTGLENAHNLYNHTDQPLKILSISNNNPGTDVCHYPDSHKISSEQGFLQDGKVVSYWKDEEDPGKYWPAHVLRGEI